MISKKSLKFPITVISPDERKITIIDIHEFLQQYKNQYKIKKKSTIYNFIRFLTGASSFKGWKLIDKEREWKLFL